MFNHYSTKEFEDKYTYTGNDLGACWTENATTFRVWAPLADEVSVNLYSSGDPNQSNRLCSFPMNEAENGTWIVTSGGNWNGVYYTYSVKRGEVIAECCDPYARAVGINGYRAMVADLRSTDPENWDLDRDPNSGLRTTDCVIYELHVRDLSASPTSGISNRYRFLGLTESGTRTKSGYSTGLDHIRNLGITHLHLLPVFDYGSIDERDTTNKRFNWGYDPVNFNVPEGSYASDPCVGFSRIREMKQMVQTLHKNGISVVMDVVYNHVYHTYEFSVNQILPGYFSRQDDRNILSNGSGCGNDTASERSMVRKFIVDSVNYWADEYHIDGFRFDLVGLLDCDTINEIMVTVKKRHSNVIFYGEGWNLPTTVTKPQVKLATQHNAYLTPGFAYFNDIFRDTMRGSVFNYHEAGFLSGQDTHRDKLLDCFTGRTPWASGPCQVVNYISCHDNHTLHDRLAEALPDASHAELARRSRLGAAFNLLSCGIPFFQAGEEMLRSKKNRSGKYVGNSYRSSDQINAIKWKTLEDAETRTTVLYYIGLIQLRKKYDVFRMDNYQEIRRRITVYPAAVPAFLLNGAKEQFLCIFNPKEEDYDIVLPYGNWDIYAEDIYAGITVIHTVSGKVHVKALTASVLLQSAK